MPRNVCIHTRAKEHKMKSRRRFSIHMEADVKIDDEVLAVMIRRALHKEGIPATVKILPKELK